MEARKCACPLHTYTYTSRTSLQCAFARIQALPHHTRQQRVRGEDGHLAILREGGPCGTLLLGRHYNRRTAPGARRLLQKRATTRANNVGEIVVGETRDLFRRILVACDVEGEALEARARSSSLPRGRRVERPTWSLSVLMGCEATGRNLRLWCHVVPSSGDGGRARAGKGGRACEACSPLRMYGVVSTRARAFSQACQSERAGT